MKYCGKSTGIASSSPSRLPKTFKLFLRYRLVLILRHHISGSHASSLSAAPSESPRAKPNSCPTGSPSVMQSNPDVFSPVSLSRLFIIIRIYDRRQFIIKYGNIETFRLVRQRCSYKHVNTSMIAKDFNHLFRRMVKSADTAMKKQVVSFLHLLLA